MEMWHGANFLSTVTICSLKALMALIAQGRLCEALFICCAEKCHRKHKISRLLFVAPSPISHNSSESGLILREKPNLPSAGTKYPEAKSSPN